MLSVLIQASNVNASPSLVVQIRPTLGSPFMMYMYIVIDSLKNQFYRFGYHVSLKTSGPYPDAITSQLRVHVLKY